MIETKQYFDDIEAAIIAINFLILTITIPVAFSNQTLDFRIIEITIVIVLALTAATWVHKSERSSRLRC